MAVVVADDDHIVREVIQASFRTDPEVKLVGQAADGREAITMLQKLRPNVLVLDLLMPGLPGLEVLRELTHAQRTVHTIVFSSAINEGIILQALQLGAKGVVSKSDLASLGAAIRTVFAGHYWVVDKPVANVIQLLQELSAKLAVADDRPYRLTAREREIILLITQGCTNKDIAEKLGISEETVKRHLTNIFDKVGMSNRLELALFALSHGLVQG